MDIEEIFEKTTLVIENSCGIPAKDINLDDTLFNKLEIDSLDLVDILFDLESIFEVQLKISDLELKTRNALKGKPFEVNGEITTEGLVALKEFMNEVDPNHFVEGLTIYELSKLFTVKSLCKLVQYKLQEKKEN